MTTDLIVLKQLPVIEEQLQQVKETVNKRVTEAASLVCTEKTRKDVKAVRAALNKEFDAFEQQRKEIRKQILAPYEAFEAVYRECVSDPYKSADSALKIKIDAVEDALKEEKAAELIAYFEEGKQSRSIPADFLSWEESGIKVTLSASITSLKKKVDALLDRIAGELAYIQTLEHADEVMVEYRQSHNVIRAVEAVTARHMQMQTEQERRTEAEPEAPAETVEAEPVAEQPKVSIALRVSGTPVQIESLKAFLNSGAYQYTVILMGGEKQ